MGFTEQEKQEKEEIRRSAVEAADRAETIVVDFAKLARYAGPPADTPFPLEYSFYLLGKSEAGRRGLTVLDYGCGAGENLIPLAATGADVIGLDISPELIQLARKRAEAYNVRARFIVGSAYKTGLPPASVDIVFAIAILHHLDLAAAKEELFRVLKPNGVIIIQEPVRDSKLVNFLRFLMPADHDDISAFEKPLTREQLDMLSDGLQCDSIRRFRLPVVAIAPRISRRLTRSAYALDARLLRSFPSLRHFATIEVRKLTWQRK